MTGSGTKNSTYQQIQCALEIFGIEECILVVYFYKKAQAEGRPGLVNSESLANSQVTFRRIKRDQFPSNETVRGRFIDFLRTYFRDLYFRSLTENQLKVLELWLRNLCIKWSEMVKTNRDLCFRKFKFEGVCHAQQKGYMKGFRTFKEIREEFSNEKQLKLLASLRYEKLRESLIETSLGAIR